MKVGEYVRTEYGIAKYIKDKTTEYGMYYIVDKDIMTCNIEGWENCLSGSYEIIKSSPNIIDLIEVGDYVNGEKVEWVGKFEEDDTQNICHVETGFVFNNSVKSIVTKEQFSQMEYKVGD